MIASTADESTAMMGRAIEVGTEVVTRHLIASTAKESTAMVGRAIEVGRR